MHCSNILRYLYEQSVASAQTSQNRPMKLRGSRTKLERSERNSFLLKRASWTSCSPIRWVWTENLSQRVRNNWHWTRWDAQKTQQACKLCPSKSQNCMKQFANGLRGEMTQCPSRKQKTLIEYTCCSDVDCLREWSVWRIDFFHFPGPRREWMKEMKRILRWFRYSETPTRQLFNIPLVF